MAVRHARVVNVRSRMTCGSPTTAPGGQVGAADVSTAGRVGCGTSTKTVQSPLDTGPP